MPLARKTAPLVIALCLLLSAAPPAATAMVDKECVVLLHGLGRDSGSMARMEESLQEQGYTVFNLDYPSTKKPIKKLSVHVGEGAEECLKAGAERVHFITHSLGGILVRHFLETNAIDGLGRVVMIAPPNKGSEVAEFFKSFSFYRKRYGPAGSELGIGPESVPLRLGPVTYEVGVIAGQRHEFGDALFSLFLIPGPDDGKVSVESARVDGMKDFVLLGVAHRHAPEQGPVIGQAVRFLKAGAFEKE